MNEPLYVAQTLAWCNARRKERGEEPLEKLPRGKRYSGESCPCGEATGLFVETVGAYASRAAFEGAVEGNRLADTPEPVKRFIYDFDAGHLPQYDIEANS